jgi:hypothetical protein
MANWYTTPVWTNALKGKLIFSSSSILDIFYEPCSAYHLLLLWGASFPIMQVTRYLSFLLVQSAGLRLGVFLLSLASRIRVPREPLLQYMLYQDKSSTLLYAEA